MSIFFSTEKQMYGGNKKVAQFPHDNLPEQRTPQDDHFSPFIDRKNRPGPNNSVGQYDGQYDSQNNRQEFNKFQPQDAYVEHPNAPLPK